MHTKKTVYLPNEVVKAHAIDGKPLLRAWREHKALTQTDMARRMGISQTAYSRIEHSAAPGPDILAKAARALDIDPRLLEMED